MRRNNLSPEVRPLWGKDALPSCYTLLMCHGYITMSSDDGISFSQINVYGCSEWQALHIFCTKSIRSVKCLNLCAGSLDACNSWLMLLV